MLSLSLTSVHVSRSATENKHAACVRASLKNEWIGARWDARPKLTHRMTGTRQEILRCVVYMYTLGEQPPLPCSKLQLMKNNDMQSWSSLVAGHVPAIGPRWSLIVC